MRHVRKQLTLGDLILRLGNIKNQNLTVMFTFGSTYPDLDSWNSYRGRFEDISISFDRRGESPKVAAVLASAKKQVGRLFGGWKGGEYGMGEETPVWITESGSASETALVDVVDVGWCVLLVTEHKEILDLQEGGRHGPR